MAFRKLGLCILTTVWAGVLPACADPADEGGLRRATRSDAAAESGDTERQEGEPPDTQHWVAVVGGVEDSKPATDIRVGIVTDRRKSARLFFCGGATTFANATRWVVVELNPDDGSFEYDEDGWRVSGAPDERVLAGKLEREGRDTYGFRAEPVDPDITLAGLYEGTSECGRIGLIVMPAKTSEGPTAQGACIGGELPEQVNPILPIREVEGGIRVKVGDTEALVHEATPPGS